MKHLKKLMTAAMALFMVLAVSTVAFAANDGSITITNAEAGKDYKLYKLFDATVSAAGDTAYMLPSGKTADSVKDDEYFNTYFELDNGYVTKKAAFTDAVLKTEAFKTWAKTFAGNAVATKQASNGTVEFTGIPYGYYFIEAGNGATLTVDSANPHADVVDKNSTVDFDKNIVEGENKVKVNEAGLNEDVNFEIAVDTKNFESGEKVYKYFIYDTLDAGFSMTSAPVVKVGDTTLGSDKYTITYKADKDAAGTLDSFATAEYFEIAVPWTQGGTKEGAHLYDNGAKLTITYTAKLDPAKAADVKYNAANKNTAEVKFTKGTDEPDSTTPSGSLGKKETETYDTSLTITKKDGAGATLTGAQFTLSSTNGTKVTYVSETKYVEDAAGTYYKLKDGTYTSEAPNNNETHDSLYDSTDTKYKLVTEYKALGEGQTPSTMVSYVGADGTVTFKGLGAGDYKIEETVVPAGYNKADDVEFTISFDTKDKKFSSSNTDVVLDEANNVFKTDVINNKGTELPSTGGMGTTIIYTVGGLMIAGGLVALLAKQRMSNLEA